MKRVGLLLASLVVTRPAVADVVRYAVIVGENQGDRSEPPLRFAETDAERVAEVLAELGDVPAENQVLLRGKGAGAARRALITVNDRIRTTRRDGDETVLVVYYSGHADASSLHFGSDRFELRELEALVRGSPADVRILVIDACRSGALTRVKGGRAAPPVALDQRLLGEGLVFLTASAAGEDAQESDELGGSFFTHYFVSGLLGAADADRDGEIALGEAFRFTREQTILASSRTLAGTQHPTFRYELRGRGDVVLTRPGVARRRATLGFPAHLTWLVVRDGPRGHVVAEVGASARQPTLSLRPGRYFVRGRGRDALYEGSVRLEADRSHAIRLASLDRIAYARLVRKGGGPESIDGPVVAALVRSALVPGDRPCLGALAGWSWELRQATLTPRLGLCRSAYDNQQLTATTTAASLELRISHAWDLPVVTVDLGVGLGAELFRQSFETRGEAPPRTTAAVHLDAGLGSSVDLWGKSYVWLELAVQSHFFRFEEDQTRSITAEVAARGLLGIGLRR